jgi:hypothetical protein
MSAFACIAARCWASWGQRRGQIDADQDSLWFHKPDSGTYSFDGKPVNLSSPMEARALGIQTVYQDLALVNDLSVYHNMFWAGNKRNGFWASRCSTTGQCAGSPSSI